jgi:phage shock protein A
MGQLFDRLNRVVRANLNNADCEDSSNDTGEGAALIAGGAAVGGGISATVGGMGLLVAGTGMAIGSALVAGAGAVAGAAAYGAKKAIEEGDASALGAAALGAVGGSGVSAVVGGMGLAVAGTAVGIGMAPVAAAGAVVGLGAYGLNQLLEQGTDEEKLLEQAIAQMQEALLQLRLAVVRAVASQKRIQQQYAQAQAEVDKWQQRVQLALQKGDENLARQALICKKSKAETAKALKAQLEQQGSQVNTLKRQLKTMEEIFEQAKTKRDELKARLSAAKAQLQLQSTMSSLNTGGSMAAFERMEEKVLMMEARSQAVAELAGADLESQFAMLESGSDVDDELARMKAELAGSPKPQGVLPCLQEKASSSFNSAVDEELEALHQQIDNL